MGLTYQSTRLGSLKNTIIKDYDSKDLIIALAGNPNTGKSTVFNSLTGLKQHTGNWPGKTVTNAQGSYRYKENNFVLVDLPGTYSLFANSVEEGVARDFICFGQPDATVVVLDATCLERNLNLALQILEITDKVVVCVNLLDEAKRKKISIDLAKLSARLGVPVVGTNARDGVGLTELKEAILQVATGKTSTRPLRLTYPPAIEEALSQLIPLLNKLIKENSSQINTRWLALRFLDEDKSFFETVKEHIDFDFSLNTELMVELEKLQSAFTEDPSSSNIIDQLVESIVVTAEDITTETVSHTDQQYNAFDRKLDRILTSKALGIPCMLALLGIVFWLTIKGANYPSELLATGFAYLENLLSRILLAWGAPSWLHGILVLGVFKTLSWVVSVMLPPMAIFFPLFTLLEDLGYLPRVAFNLDNFFKRACAHGKQSLTMCMGFGCNAAGVIACRIIDSPRERLIAIITNNFVPCNGRFPLLIALSTIFIAARMGRLTSIGASLTVLALIILGVFLTLAVSRVLSQTILKGLPSSFTLELPPYRKPQIGRIIVRSILDRTLFVLGRAIVAAAPAGAIIWLMANITINDLSILNHCANLLNPLAYLIGLDGFILMAFILGLPANEIVIPILIMSYLSQGTMLELESLESMRKLFLANGWTWLTAVCTMLIALNHWPCATTLLTIRRESRSLKWTFVSFIVPTITGFLLCFIVTQLARFFGLA
ncbi:MAG: ferrous iron transport protein B [Peptococcia bacterium]